MMTRSLLDNYRDWRADGPGDAPAPRMAGEHGLNMAATEEKIAGLSDRAIDELMALAAKVKSNRYTYRLKAQAAQRFYTHEAWFDGFQGLANFMLGIAHAAACRAWLRASKGHVPFAKGPKGPGGTPTSGEMWHAHEGAQASEGVYARRPRSGDANWRSIRHNPLAQTAHTFKALTVMDGPYERWPW